MKTSTCIFLFHLHTGDNFTFYGAVRHLQKMYRDVYIFCLYRNRHTIMQLYQPYDNVHIIISDENHRDHLAPISLVNQLISKINNDFNLFITGMYDRNFNHKNHFWEECYNVLGLSYKIRYDYEDINRNKERELNLYNLIVSKYGEKYIFLHDHRSVKNKHHCDRGNVYVESELPVFHPNMNYYSVSLIGSLALPPPPPENNCNYHLWSSEFSTDNLLDYCTLIENATEIHIGDSSFSCLMPFLDLKNVKKKCIHTSLDMPNYHNEYANWEIVKRS